jgi:hypothetical protein
MAIPTGTRVCWAWGHGRTGGTLMAIHRDTASRAIKDSEVARHTAVRLRGSPCG